MWTNLRNHHSIVVVFNLGLQVYSLRLHNIQLMALVYSLRITQLWNSVPPILISPICSAWECHSTQIRRVTKQRREQTRRRLTPVVFFGEGPLIPRADSVLAKGPPSAAANWRHRVTSANPRREKSIESWTAKHCKMERVLGRTKGWVFWGSPVCNLSSHIWTKWLSETYRSLYNLNSEHLQNNDQNNTYFAQFNVTIDIWLIP